MSVESSSKLNTSQTRNSVSVIRKLIRDPMGAVGLFIVLSFLLIALFADLIAPYDPNKIDILNKLQGPSLNHLVGTDQLGRDTLSRLIHGTQIALLVAIVSISLAVLTGSLLGAIAGYGPAWLDFVIMLIFDTMRSYQGLCLLLRL